MHTQQKEGKNKSHRKIIFIIIGFILVIGGYFSYKAFNKSDNTTKYVLTSVQRGSIALSVSGSGQVLVSNQLDIKSKVSGDIIYVGAIKGAEVKTGEVLIKLDTRDAERAVRDAESNLESARLSFDKLKKPADQLSLLQAENALIQSRQSLENAKDSLTKSYDEGSNVVANAFLDMPSVMTGLDNILNGSTINVSQSNASSYYDMIKNSKQNADKFLNTALSTYQSARTAYEKNFQDYKNTSRYSDLAVIESLITETYDTTKLISEAIKNTKNFLDLVNEALSNNTQGIRPPALLSTHENNLQSYTGTANSNLSSLLNISNSIKNNQDAITSAERSIAEKTESLAKLKAGPDTLDIQSQELTIKQRENAVTDVREKLSDYTIFVSFDGVIAKSDIKKGDSISASTVIATLMNKQQMAQISLNEIDVAKIKVGQKATLTFDAIDNLSIAGHVIEIDAIGTVTQGVVTYNVKIIFDTEDDRVKSGMSVNAIIITEIKQDILFIANGAVKTQGDTYYVEVLNGLVSQGQNGSGVSSLTPPISKDVEVGISNDTDTEIISGLNEGDQAILRVIATSTNKTATAPSLFGSSGGGQGGGGGAMRMLR